MGTRVLMGACLLVSLGIVSGCGGGRSNSGPVVAPADQAEADQIFATRCATCHGPQGRGNGPGSAGLNPQPRNFADTSWQGSVTDEHIAQIVQYGGPAVGRSAAMPANPDLQSKPGVVAGLVHHVRSLGQ